MGSFRLAPGQDPGAATPGRLTGGLTDRVGHRLVRHRAATLRDDPFAVLAPDHFMPPRMAHQNILAGPLLCSVRARSAAAAPSAASRVTAETAPAPGRWGSPDAGWSAWPSGSRRPRTGRVHRIRARTTSRPFSPRIHAGTTPSAPQATASAGTSRTSHAITSNAPRCPSTAPKPQPATPRPAHADPTIHALES